MRILTWVNTGKKHEWYVRRMDIGKSEHCNVQFQKISVLPQQKGLEFPAGWGDSLIPFRATGLIVKSGHRSV